MSETAVITAAQSVRSRPGRSPRPSVALVLPCFNEEAILEGTVAQVREYMATLETRYAWEIVIVNDGSSDRTAQIADQLSDEIPEVAVIHHTHNCGLCQALKTAFERCGHDYIVTLDTDLSYAPEHIGRLLERIVETKAAIVRASPDLEGGSVKNVPWLRKTLSKGANRFISLVAPENIHTFTGLVRAYDGKFIKTLNLKSKGMDVNPEIVYKTMILRERIEEIPAHLEWREQDSEPQADSGSDGEPRRRSSMHLPWHTLATLFSGFVFRPFLFFLIPGFILLLVSFGLGCKILLEVGGHYGQIENATSFLQQLSSSFAWAFREKGHIFLVFGLSLITAIQFLSLGFLSMQNKRYFEVMFHIATSILTNTKERDAHVSPSRQS